MSVDDLEWENQRVFLAVLRSGSLSGAARMLGIAQATARRRVEKLEAALGTSLFTRTPSGLVPTEQAHALGEHVDAMDTAARAFNRRANAGASSVRITSSELLGVQVLPPLLAGVRQALPELRLELSVSDRLEALARQESDIAVRLQRPTEASVVTRRVGALQVGLYATPACIECHGLPLSFAALKDMPVIGPDRRLADHRRLVQEGVFTPEQTFLICSDSHLAQFAALRAGLGFGLCPQQLAEPAGLVQVLAAEVNMAVDIWIAMHHDLRRVKRAATVFDLLGAALEGFLAGALNQPPSSAHRP